MRFDEFADVYPHKAFIQKELASWTREWLDSDWNATKRILELGAGTGFLTQYFNTKQTQIKAIDSCPQMIRNGQKLCPNADWTQADAWSYSNGSSYDLITSCSLFQWMPQPKQTLTQLAKNLKPKGRMLHGFFISPSLHEITSIDPEVSPFSWHNQNEWESYFSQSGLRILRSQAQTHQFTFPSAGALFTFFKQTGAADKNRISPSHLLHIIREYNHRFLSAEGIKSTWTFFRIEVEKIETA